MEGLVETTRNPSLNNYGGGDDYDAGNFLIFLFAMRVELSDFQQTQWSVSWCYWWNTKIHHIEVMTM